MATSRFEEALKRNPAPPRVLGDVQLSYDPPLLVGRGSARQTVLPTAALILGTVCGLGALAAFGLLADSRLLAALVVATGLSFVANLLLERRAVRPRKFVVHFAEKTLRLDFASALASRPRTLLADFERVRAVDVVPTLGGTLALTVDFVPNHGPPQLLREVLFAFVPEAQRGELEKVKTLLENAFAPAVPVAQPAPDEPSGEPPAPVDAFVP